VIHPRNRRRRTAFTLFEVMIVVAIIGIVAAAAIPGFRGYQRNQAMRAAVRSGLGLFSRAKSLALAENRNHVVLFNVGPGTDICGNPIVDVNGNPAPILVIDDGPPGTGNCCIDPGELVESLTLSPYLTATASVTWGAALAGAPAPLDVGGATSWATTGSSFRTPAGLPARGVLFRTDGVPVTFSNACVLGTTGGGGGALYVTNNDRDYAIVLSPIGAASIERWDPASNTWGN
jgi:prepilin-type N-terminal cleavage/methylation domain-containing protein